MVRNQLSRRNFSRYAFAALGGIAAGSLAVSLTGCGGGQPSGGTAPTSNSTAPANSSVTPIADAKTATSDMHACAGLNGCKGKGADGKNACAGQGGCASAAMKHECKGHNACKGQGGCGEMLGKNDCKGHGSCAVPMKDQTAWQKARDKFEAKMKVEGKEVGPAPAKT